MYTNETPTFNIPSHLRFTALYLLSCIVYRVFYEGYVVYPIQVEGLSCMLSTVRVVYVVYLAEGNSI